MRTFKVVNFKTKQLFLQRENNTECEQNEPLYHGFHIRKHLLTASTKHVCLLNTWRSPGFQMHNQI